MKTITIEACGKKGDMVYLVDRDLLILGFRPTIEPNYILCSHCHAYLEYADNVVEVECHQCGALHKRIVNWVSGTRDDRT